MPRPSFTPAPRSPHAADLPCPPAAAAFLAAFSRGAAAPLWMPLASLGGWPPPLRPRPRRWRGWARAPGAGHSSPCRHAFGVHGWAPGGTRSLTLARLRLGRCPRREDRRGSSRRSAALFRPAGFGWGRARLPSLIEEFPFPTDPATSLHRGRPPHERFPRSS